MRVVVATTTKPPTMAFPCAMASPRHYLADPGPGAASPLKRVGRNLILRDASVPFLERSFEDSSDSDSDSDSDSISSCCSSSCVSRAGGEDDAPSLASWEYESDATERSLLLKTISFRLRIASADSSSMGPSDSESDSSDGDDDYDDDDVVPWYGDRGANRPVREWEVPRTRQPPTRNAAAALWAHEEEGGGSVDSTSGDLACLAAHFRNSRAASHASTSVASKRSDGAPSLASGGTEGTATGSDRSAASSPPPPPPSSSSRWFGRKWGAAAADRGVLGFLPSASPGKAVRMHRTASGIAPRNGMTSVPRSTN